MQIGKDSEAGSAGLIRSDDHDFVAQILASLMQLFDERVQVRRVAAVSAVPPLLKCRTLLQLILEDLVGLVQELTEVGDADIQQGVRGNPLQQITAVPGLGKRNLFEPVLDCGELRQQDQVLFTILAPGDLLCNRFGAQVVVGTELIAGMHQRIHSRMHHLNGSLQDCYA